MKISRARRLVLPTAFAAATFAAACGLSSVGTSTSVLYAGDGGPTLEGGGEMIDGAMQFEVDGGAPTDATNETGPLDPYYTRVTSGLVSLYEFEEADSKADGGATVHDTAPNPFDLLIDDTGHAKWQPHFLTFSDFTRIQNSNTAANLDKLITACTLSNEVTAEAWFKYADKQDDYSRIVTMAPDENDRDFALGTYTGSGPDTFWAAIEPNQDLLAATLVKTLVHLVMTRTMDGQLHLYVNGLIAGVPIASTGDPNIWKPYPLIIGNVADNKDNGRGVKGDFHLVAIYGRALTSAEVTQNYNAGPDPGLVSTTDK